MGEEKTMIRRCLNCMKEFEIPSGHENEDNCCPHCGFIENTLPINATHLKSGVLLRDRYTVGTVIGAGGFGITYKAWDNTLENVVAIKEFFPQGLVLRDNTREGSVSNSVSVYNVQDVSFQHGKERFLKEARSIAKFNSNPGTVVIYDFFEENGTAYIVMEYLDGCNMKEYMSTTGKVVPYEMLCSLIDTVCDVLKEVHYAGLIHRDISPDNIFMTKKGSFKLIDFGSVKQGLSDSNLSSTIILKHGYAPIEQYAKSGNVGPWTDVYSFGATIYRLATGVLLQESVERIASDNVIDIHKLNDKLPLSFCNAVMKAISIQKVDRFQSIDEFKQALLVKNLRQEYREDEGAVLLNDKAWDKAFRYYYNCTLVDPENASAHLGLFLARNKYSDLNDFLSSKIAAVKNVKPIKKKACEPDYPRIQKIVEKYSVKDYLDSDKISNTLFYKATYESYVDGLIKEKDIYNDKNWKDAERLSSGELRTKIISVKNQHMVILESMINKCMNDDYTAVERIKLLYKQFIDRKEKQVEEMSSIAQQMRRTEYKELCKKIKTTDSITECVKVMKELAKFEDEVDYLERKNECMWKLQVLKSN